MPNDEDERAAEYRRMMQAREDNKLLREEQLAGNPDALRRLHERMDPVIADTGWEPDRKVIDDES